jgi:hypothetical protein
LLDFFRERNVTRIDRPCRDPLADPFVGAASLARLKTPFQAIAKIGTILSDRIALRFFLTPSGFELIIEGCRHENGFVFKRCDRRDWDHGREGHGPCGFTLRR